MSTFNETCVVTFDRTKLTHPTQVGLIFYQQCPHDIARLEVFFNQSNYDLRVLIDLLYRNKFMAEPPAPSFGEYLSNSPYTLAAFIIGILAILCNVLCLIVMFRIRMALSGHRLFIMSLCFSDSFVCVMYNIHVQMQYVNDQLTAPSDRNPCMEDILSAMLYSGYLLSLLNLVGMAIDHFIGILRPLYYCRWMSSRNTTLALVAIWSAGTLIGTAPYWIFFIHTIFTGDWSKGNYCAKVMQMGIYYYPAMLLVITPISFTIILVSYSRIFRKIGDLHRRSPHLLSQIEIRKATITTLLIVATFAICWGPWCAIDYFIVIYLRFMGVPYNKVSWKTLIIVEKLAMVFLNLNALLDPLIYTFRMAQIRSRMAHVLCIEAIRQRLRRTKGFSQNKSQSAVGLALVQGSEASKKKAEPKPSLASCSAMPHYPSMIANSSFNSPDGASSLKNSRSTTVSTSAGSSSGHQSAAVQGSRSNSGQSDPVIFPLNESCKNQMITEVTDEEEPEQNRLLLPDKSTAGKEGDQTPPPSPIKPCQQ